ncbi:hypothetical protein Tco_0251002 [Tanacetum coccineum]
MDSIISLGQKNTLAEYMILSELLKIYGSRVSVTEVKVPSSLINRREVSCFAVPCVFSGIFDVSVTNEYVNIEMQICESCDKCLHLDAEFSKSKQAFNALLKSHSQLEKHCISFEISNQEIFQKDESCINQNALEILEYFEKNDLKAQLQDKDTIICKLKDIIKSIREKSKDDNVNNDLCELETKNVDLENSVAKLLSEIEPLCKEINHLKQVFKDQFDSIKKIRVRTKEQRKEIFENVVHIPSANTIASGMFKLDLEPLPPRLLQNREVHIDYLRNTQEQANILWEIVKQAKVVVTPMNNVKKVRFTEPLTSLRNSKHVESSNTSDSNTHVMSSTGVKCSTSNCGSKPLGNKRNDRISQTPSRNKKNQV